MNNTDFIQLNKFSSLHNNKDTIFCKTDFIFDDFRYISQLNNDVILITGNSDYPITDQIVEQAPKNIKKWFAQNALSYSDVLEPLPIGLENKIESVRTGHGVSYSERVNIKEKLIKNIRTVKPKIYDKIYANFNIDTNLYYRSQIKNICNKTGHIVWEEPNYDLYTYYQKLSEYQMILCPIGNGIDTHRLWETLYCNRIPVTIKNGNYKIYQLYHQLPIIVLDNINQLYDYNFLLDQYKTLINKKYNNSLLCSNHWEEKIRDIYV